MTREAHRLGAAVVAVHHASPALNAAGTPRTRRAVSPRAEEDLPARLRARRRGDVDGRSGAGLRPVRRDQAPLRPRPRLPPGPGDIRRRAAVRRPGLAREANRRHPRGDGASRLGPAAADRRRRPGQGPGRGARPTTRSERSRRAEAVRRRPARSGPAVSRGGLRGRARAARDVRPGRAGGGGERRPRGGVLLDPGHGRHRIAGPDVPAQGSRRSGASDRPRARARPAIPPPRRRSAARCAGSGCSRSSCATLERLCR